MSLSAAFTTPERKIKSVFDVRDFIRSKAYSDYIQTITELNDSVKGVKTSSDLLISSPVVQLIDMLGKFENWISQYPPENDAYIRFGNKSFRKWHERLANEAESSIKHLLPPDVTSAVVELSRYLVDSFGNPIRIDYGTGHEANFVIFVHCLRSLHVFKQDDAVALVLCVFNRYLQVVRKLLRVYGMEPAGSRGVHSLDDYHFLPFLWGSAQLLGHQTLIPESYLSAQLVETNASDYLFFDAVKFINETKYGPFSEHSNQLWNISAVKTWEKVNSGMFKMYEAEVLKKHPVAQHFLFGTIFSFEAK